MTMTSMIPVVLVIVMVMMMIAISLDGNVSFVHMTKRANPGLIDNYAILVENLYLKYVLSVSLH